MLGSIALPEIAWLLTRSQIHLNQQTSSILPSGRHQIYELCLQGLISSFLYL